MLMSGKCLEVATMTVARQVYRALGKLLKFRPQSQK
jgi:hypothetical protein